MPSNELRMHVSLADSSLRWVRIGQWALVSALIVALGVSAWLLLDRWSLDEQTARLDQAAARLQETNLRLVQDAVKVGVDLSEARLATLSKDVAFAQYLRKQHAFSWTRFLSDLESAVPPRVSVGSVGLNFKDSVITLNGAAQALTDLTVFVNELERHDAFQNVVLSHHRFQAKPQQAARGGSDAREPGAAEFTLTVTYKPQGSDE